MILAPWVGAVLAGLLPRYARNGAAALSWVVALVGLVSAILLYPNITDGPVRHEIRWMPSLGIDFVLRLDGLSWLFSVLVLGIGALVVLYARYYMSPKDPVPRFFAYLLAFMGAMQGVVMAGNLVQLAIFWELTSLFSFLLIGYWYNNQLARDGARMALTVTAAGGLCLLIGVLLLGHIAGSYDLDVVLGAGDQIKRSPLYLPMLVFVLLGAFTKSAQFPFHFWLPRAMAAPTPVSAYLHSATMVKAGIFLMMRLWPVLAGTEEWYAIVGTAGILTLLIGAYAAIFQHDLKGLLAYSTISHLGLITLLLGLGTPLGFVAALFHTLNHATFKASLFMAAGIIDHETGTRDLRRLSGLRKAMPITATLAIVAAAAMAGVPLLNGFLSKEMFLAEAVSNPRDYDRNLLLPVLATLASTFAVLYSLRFIHQTFFGPPAQDLPSTPHEPPHWMRFPIELLVLICVVVGIIPGLTIGPFLATGVQSVLGEATPYYSLAVWHGFNLPLLMSLVALAGGTVLYVLFRRPINTNPHGGPRLFRPFDGVRIFDGVMNGLTAASERGASVFGTNRLQPQLRNIILVMLLAAVLAALPFWSGLGANGFTLTPPDPGFVVLWLLGIGCALIAAWQAKYHRLAAVVMLGGAGLASCISFVWLSAPDLATTQLLVEVVTTVLLLLGLRWLPKRQDAIHIPPSEQRRAKARRVSDLLVAIAFGAFTAAIAFRVMTMPAAPDGIGRFFLEHAYEQGGGRNVVNVLLVDFRALDTLGEISVLGLVGLTVFALLLRFRPGADSLSAPEQQRVQRASDERHETRQPGDTLQDTMLVPRVVMQWLFPVIVLFAVHLFLRGHDEPGGGFAAGIAMSIAFILQYMASGTRWVEDRLRIRPLKWVALGLGIATLTGMGSWIFGYPFLTSWFRYAELPVLGRVPLPSAILFDIGVFGLVVGSTVLVLIALAHQSLRKPRDRAPAHPPAPPLEEVV
ncbi:monovalent cation/H+ antiporter subunit A [Mesorhizobium sp. RP14(2022)]|uniref:Monovalent cation/H+ antiporter subunit A n=1 Tax=Mesorhizobium liriopis TaxID=2953882 RepID=A0ABT1C2G4_9HYPH|nr:monovalent cation/H+ antiporter subunit A [Mesorhizobium liriopis]MCO6049017.1 monovalent cation/H+ antiporter subunit A [Mesorhizobium liriopis]